MCTRQEEEAGGGMGKIGQLNTAVVCKRGRREVGRKEKLSCRQDRRTCEGERKKENLPECNKESKKS